MTVLDNKTTALFSVIYNKFVADFMGERCVPLKNPFVSIRNAVWRPPSTGEKKKIKKSRRESR